jgi:hypothetical protein
VPDLERTPHLQSEYCKVEASIAKTCHTSSLLGTIKYVLSLNSHPGWFQLHHDLDISMCSAVIFGGCVKLVPLLREHLMHILLGILYAEFGIIDFARSSNSRGNAKDDADGGENLHFDWSRANKDPGLN